MFAFDSSHGRILIADRFLCLDLYHYRSYEEILYHINVPPPLSQHRIRINDKKIKRNCFKVRPALMNIINSNLYAGKILGKQIRKRNFLALSERFETRNEETLMVP